MLKNYRHPNTLPPLHVTTVAQATSRDPVLSQVVNA
ncbi:unnamed protein product, partial [Ixodes persulcatus]